MTGADDHSMSFRNEYVRELEAEINRQRRIINILNTELENWRIVAMKFGDVFYHNQIPMMVSSFEEGIIIEVNEALIDATGYTRKEMLNRCIIDLQIWADSQERSEIVKEIAEQGYVRNRYTEFRMKNGEIGMCLLASSLIELDGNRCLITSVLNIHKQIELQRSLEQAHEKFSKAFYKNQTIMSISNADGVYLEANDKAVEVTGYSKEEIIGQNVFQLGLWGDLSYREKMIQMLQEQGYIENWEFPFRRKNGEKGYVMSSINLIEIDGEPCVLASMQDITERRKAEESLKQSQQLLQQIFNKMPLSIMMVSPNDLRIIYVNDNFINKNMLDKKNLLEEQGVTLLQFTDRDDIQKLIARVLDHGYMENMEINHRLLTGESRTSLISGTRINWEGEACVLLIGNDITELRHYQKEMARLDNLKLIGQMAAGMAHEVRNPMTSIRGYLELFRMRDSYKKDIDALELMIEEIDRLNELITIFMSLAHEKNAMLKPQYIKAAILNLMPLILVDAYQKNIMIETDLQDNVQVMIDEAQIRQLIFNLVRNGLDAMPGGGVLKVSTYQDSDGVNLVVQDQGSGIPSDVLGQIGTPFFTTKDEGTGLGLPVCYSIVENHQAKIDLTTGSEGTAFKITFPLILGESNTD